jgi:hypothetical protein
MVNIVDVISHPLSLLLIGGLLSGLLFPYFTNRWQNHQKELDIKIDLVGRISESIMNMIMAIQFIEVSIQQLKVQSLDLKEKESEFHKKERDLEQAKLKPTELREQEKLLNLQSKLKKERDSLSGERDNLNKRFQDIQKIFTELNVEYKKFEVSSAMIGTHLQAYFAKTDIGQRWTGLSERVVLFYSMTEEDFNEAKLAGSKDIVEEWLKNRNEILDEKSNIIQLVLKSHVSTLPAHFF